MEKVTCGTCGSEYELSEQSLPVRDKDSIQCRVCGEELYEWNGAHSFSAKLTNRAEWPKKTTSN